MIKEIDYYLNEEETRAELIDPQLKKCGWSTTNDVKVRREYYFTDGKILGAGKKGKPKKADYILEYKKRQLAVVEAKEISKHFTEGVLQAKDYAQTLNIRFAYSTNGKQIYQIDLDTGEECEVSTYPTPQQLYKMVFSKEPTDINFKEINYETVGNIKVRYYQKIAIDKTLEKIANGKKRMLLTLATGTGKTFIACQIAWKLFQARWNLQQDGKRLPRILFLADRNILANQAFNEFSIFPEDAMVRIKPEEIRKNNYKVPTNANLFFTIFQTFMSSYNNKNYFGQYSKDFFDFIIIDECHRAGASIESTWRGILEYFNTAVQLVMTATPKRQENADTYEYFGEPLYTYSLKQGIDDGFLTPFRVKQYKGYPETYKFDESDDYEDVQEIFDKTKTYELNEINTKIEFDKIDRDIVKEFMSQINENEKTLVFCASQRHALKIRDYINQIKKSSNPNYCVRVTADDGEIGEKFLRQFRSNDNTIPTILTTSRKLSTGVDAKNVRNIVLLRPIKSIIEFKQIIGRGTRLFDGKDYFTIHDFVNAYENFQNPQWDGEPQPHITSGESSYIRYSNDGKDGQSPEQQTPSKPPIIPTKIILGKGREIKVKYLSVSFYDFQTGKPISFEDYMQNFYNTLPNFFKNEEELRKIWSNPKTRKELLKSFEKVGYDINKFNELKEFVFASNSDIYDFLVYIAFDKQTMPIERKDRVNQHKQIIYSNIKLSKKQKEFIDFVLDQYIKDGVSVLDMEQISSLINLKYDNSVRQAIEELGGSINTIRETFSNFQKYLYLEK